MTLPPTQAKLRRLPNGLEVLIVPDHHHPLVSVQLWVRAGSIHEESWAGSGMAHLVEHMFFKGTATRNATQISQEIQAHGGYVNAYTTYNRTVYWIDGMKAGVSQYVEILADMARNSLFDEEELQKEKEVIRREFAMDLDDPDAVLQHVLQETAFLDHPLKHPIIGHLEVFNQATRRDLLEFIHRHYIPNRCFLVIAGDVNEAEILEVVERHFGTWERKPYAPVCFPVEFEQTSKREARKSFNTEITRLSLGWRIGGENHVDRPALEALGMILGSGRSSRLTRKLREELGIVSSVVAGPWCIEPFGLFGIEAECEEEDLEEVEGEIQAQVESIQTNGVTETELNKALRASYAQALKARSTVSGLAALVATNWVQQGNPDADQSYLQKLSQLTPHDIQEVAQRYLIPETLTRVSLHPSEEEPSEIERVPKTSQNVSNEEIRFHTFSDGWRVILQRNSKLPLISTRIQFMAGLPKETPETVGLTQMLARWMMKGTKQFSADQLSSALEDLGGRLFVTGDLHRLVAGADCMRGDEALSFDLLKSLVHEATLPKSEWKKLLKLQLVEIQEDEEDPLNFALNEARSQVFHGGAYEKTALGTPASLRGLSGSQGQSFYTAITQPHRGVISVVGDIDPDEVLQQLAKTFEAPSASNLVSTEEIYTSTAPVGDPGEWNLKLEKEQSVLVLGFRTVGFHHEHAPVLQLIDEACSDMGSRLFEKIREDLGLAYYVGTQVFHALGAGAFYFYIGTDAEKMEQAERELRILLDDFVKTGLDEQELERAKKSSLYTWRKAQQANGNMADHLGWDELNGLGYDHFKQVPEQLQAVTVEQVHSIMQQYFKLDQSYLVRIIAS